MLTKLSIKNFKVFDEVDIELGDRVVFIGPNNSGKTSALQALALWSLGVKRWVEKRGNGDVPEKRSGVTINRRDMIALPIPSADLMWRNLKVRETDKDKGKGHTRNVLIQIEVSGVDGGISWTTAMEFDYANPESFYCRAIAGPDGKRGAIPTVASTLRLAFLPPMSGLASNETRLDQGAIDVRIGEGRTAEVLRNLCWSIFNKSKEEWQAIADQMQRLFGVRLSAPEYIQERGEIAMSFVTRDGVTLDLSASGRGQQQTLLLLTHLAANPGSTLMLDEPDAHLEILRQRQIYQLLSDAATRAQSQIIAASHSEVILNEAADRDTVVAFIGRPHRIDDRGAQARKALKEIGFEHYALAQQKGWVLYLEGATDLAILKALARVLNHPAQDSLDAPFVHYVANQPAQARHHFFGLREAKPDLRGVALFDRIEGGLQDAGELKQLMWKKREIENYLADQDALIAFAEEQGRLQNGDLFASSWGKQMQDSIAEVENALKTLGRDPWGPDIKASEELLTPIFKNFYDSLKLPNLMNKTDFHTLAPFVSANKIAGEVRDKLDEIEKASRG